MERIIESAAQTAKKVRKALKESFPAVKFSVRSSNYAGGSSVYVKYTDGPMQNEVQRICDKFKSASFDGMQDLKSYHGYVYEGKLYDGADYITASRDRSLELIAKLEKKAIEIYGSVNRNHYEYWEVLNKAEKALTGYKEEWEKEEFYKFVDGNGAKDVPDLVLNELYYGVNNDGLLVDIRNRDTYEVVGTYCAGRFEIVRQ